MTKDREWYGRARTGATERTGCPVPVQAYLRKRDLGFVALEAVFFFGVTGLALAAGFLGAGLAGAAFPGASLASVFDSAAGSVFSGDGAASLSSPTRLRLDSFSDLKSVSYQPDPLSRNTGADTRRFNADLPQLGHFFNDESLIFWSTSR